MEKKKKKFQWKRFFMKKKYEIDEAEFLLFSNMI